MDERVVQYSTSSFSPHFLSAGKGGGLGEEAKFYNCELDFFADLRPGACKYSDPKKNHNSRSIIFKVSGSPD